MLKSLTRPHHHPTTVGDIEATILTPRFGEAWADTLADVRPILLGCEQVDEPRLIERVSAFFFHLRQASLEVPDVRASGLLLLLLSLLLLLLLVLRLNRVPENNKKQQLIL